MELDPSTQGARTTQLGSSLSAGQRLQHVVPPHTWFGAAPAEGTAWALVGCTVAPGERRQVCRQAGRGVRPGHSTGLLLAGTSGPSDCMCCAVLSSHEPQVSSLRTLSLGTGSSCCASSRRRRPGSSGSWLTERAARVLKEAFPAFLLKRSLYMCCACDPCCGQNVRCAMLPSARHLTHLCSRLSCTCSIDA